MEFLSPFPLFFLLAIVLLFKRNVSALYILLFFLYVASTPIVSRTLRSHIEKGFDRITVNDLEKSQVVIALSAGMRGPYKNGRKWDLTFPTYNRFEGALMLFERGKAEYIVFTGAKSRQASSAQESIGQILRAISIERGIPRTRILVTEECSNTEEEAIRVAELLKLHNLAGAKAVLVTSASHMKRASYLFRQYGLNVVPFPVEQLESKTFSWRDLLASSADLLNSENAVRELLSTTYYINLKSY